MLYNKRKPTQLQVAPKNVKFCPAQFEVGRKNVLRLLS
jgi:hypothetical protein